MSVLNKLQPEGVFAILSSCVQFRTARAIQRRLAISV